MADDEGYNDNLVDDSGESESEDVRRRRLAEEALAGDDAPMALPENLPTTPPESQDMQAPASGESQDMPAPAEQGNDYAGGSDQDYNASAEDSGSLLKQLMGYLYDKHGVNEEGGQGGEQKGAIPDDGSDVPANYAEQPDKSAGASGEWKPETPSGMDVTGDQGPPDTSMGGMLGDAVSGVGSSIAEAARGLTPDPAGWLSAGGNAIKHGLARYMGREDALNAEELRAAELAVTRSKAIQPEGYRPDYDPGAARMKAEPGIGKAERESIPERAQRERDPAAAGIMTEKERNTEALRHIAQTKGLDAGASALQRYAHEYSTDLTHAAAALNHGDVDASTKLFNEAYKKVPNGKDVFAVQNGTGVSIVSTNLATGQSKSTQLSLTQFHDILRGPMGQWDHVATRDFDKDLAELRRVNGRPLEPVNPQVAQALQQKMGPNVQIDPKTGRMSENTTIITNEQSAKQFDDVRNNPEAYGYQRPAAQVPTLDWRAADVQRKAEAAARASGDRQFVALVARANTLDKEGKEVPKELQDLIQKRTNELLHGPSGASTAGGGGGVRTGSLPDGRVVQVAPHASAGAAAAGATPQITASPSRESTKGAGGAQHNISASDHFAAAGVPIGRDANGDLIRSSGSERSKQIAQEEKDHAEAAGRAADREIKRDQLAQQGQQHADKLRQQQQHHADQMRMQQQRIAAQRAQQSSLVRGGGGQQRRHQ